MMTLQSTPVPPTRHVDREGLIPDTCRIPHTNSDAAKPWWCTVPAPLPSTPTVQVLIFVNKMKRKIRVSTIGTRSLRKVLTQLSSACTYLRSEEEGLSVESPTLWRLKLEPVSFYEQNTRSICQNNLAKNCRIFIAPIERNNFYSPG